ncbi:MAG: cysteine--tRNA ligase [Candidatus Bathyarchaeota archaeon]|nr:cysteine--tRNA ligase [Candidatus Bathyarchaeota archaeon]
MLKVFNTLSRKIEEFQPINGNRVNLFVCGPTVYDLSHIGHARTYIAYDIIVRYLRFKGYSLFYLMNITDVDDKIIKRARETNQHPLELANNFAQEFYKDLAFLGIKSINLFAKASEHIKEIIFQIDELIKKEYAYVVDGNVYFNVSKFKDYGKLSHQTKNELKRHRIEPDPKKKNKIDFSLWKSRKGKPVWKSPWGEGRPGWHIEDTAITLTYFGSQYDVHGGALELIFPHHEAEIAQAESMTGKKPLVKYWIHTGIVNVNGLKMSKSLGNFITIRDIAKKYNSEILRLFFAQSHYRSSIDFREDNLKKAGETLGNLNRIYKKIYDLLDKVSDDLQSEDEAVIKKIEEYEHKFYSAMDNDFNTPLAISALISLGKELDKRINETTCKGTLRLALESFDRFGSLLGLFEYKEWNRFEEKIVNELIKIIIKLREYLRKRKEWKISDEIRDKLNKMGISLEDNIDERN